MRLALVADTFAPLRSSGAVQLHDLARELARQGHLVSVIVPSPDIASPYLIENKDEFEIVRLRAPKTKGVNYLRRVLGEFAMPFAMLGSLRSSTLFERKWDGVLWYSPSIFFGPLVKHLKATSNCPGYLILRDIFPQWAADLGLLKRGVFFEILNWIAQRQYDLADTIGVESAGNVEYLANICLDVDQKVEVLNNWLAPSSSGTCTIDLKNLGLGGRSVFLYAGNMGPAQDAEIFLDLAKRLSPRDDIGFLFIGRGQDATRLSQEAIALNLDNVVFRDEIDPDEIPGLCGQCAVGLVSLAPRHKSHNIPGKFLTYVRSGLPVLASLNPGNELISLINEEHIGRASGRRSMDELESMALEMVDEVASSAERSVRARALFEREFSVSRAAKQILTAIGANVPSH